MLSGEATNSNCIVFGLTWSGLEHMIYRTRDEHSNNYTTDAVWTNSQSKQNSILRSCFHSSSDDCRDMILYLCFIQARYMYLVFNVVKSACIERSSFSFPVIENFIWIKHLLRGHPSLSQGWPLNTGLTIHVFSI